MKKETMGFYDVVGTIFRNGLSYDVYENDMLFYYNSVHHDELLAGVVNESILDMSIDDISKINSKRKPDSIDKEDKSWKYTISEYYHYDRKDATDYYYFCNDISSLFGSSASDYILKAIVDYFGTNNTKMYRITTIYNTDSEDESWKTMTRIYAENEEKNGFHIDIITVIMDNNMSSYKRYAIMMDNCETISYEVYGIENENHHYSVEYKKDRRKNDSYAFQKLIINDNSGRIISLKDFVRSKVHYSGGPHNVIKAFELKLD